MEGSPASPVGARHGELRRGSSVVPKSPYSVTRLLQRTNRDIGVTDAKHLRGDLGSFLCPGLKCMSGTSGELILQTVQPRGF